jgi:hypothetical protein
VKFKANQYRALFIAVAIGVLSGIAGRCEEVKRISSRVIDVGKVHKVHMVYGIATALILPFPVTAIIPGNAKTVKIERKEPANLVALWLLGKTVPPTNLIIISGQNRVVYDIQPNGEIHQDVLEVVGTYGGAEFEDESVKLISSGKL